MGGFTPTDVANEAIDAIGWPQVLGDIEDGSHHGGIVLRKYRQCLMQLLRASNWDFARKTAPLTLLADASGNTSLVGTAVPIPWVYEYAYPTDCMKLRFVPQGLPNQASIVPAGNIQIPSTQLVDGLGDQRLAGLRLRPARFLVATDFNYPPQIGQMTWEVQGVSPQGRTVVLTNVKNATAVYTSLVLYPSVWDSLFRAAFVAYLASEIALPIWAQIDRKFGLEMRTAQIELVKAKVQEARMVDGNEGWYSSDIPVDWMQGRRVGGGVGWYGDGGLGWSGDVGVWGYGNDACGFADGTAY